MPAEVDGDLLPQAAPYSRLKILPITVFFNECIIAGTITARGKDPGERLGEFQAILDAADGFIELIELGYDYYAEACDTLDDALDACDGEKRDLIVAGKSGDEDLNALIDMINELKAELGF